MRARINRDQAPRVSGGSNVPLLFALSLTAVLSGLIACSGIAWANTKTCTNSASPGFRTYLPDCRAYELVTPIYKEAQPVIVNTVGIEGGEGSPQFLIRSFGSFSGVGDQTGQGGLYDLERESSGEWISTSISAPFAMFPFFDVNATSLDLTASLWVARVPGGSERETYYVRNSRGAFTPIGPAQPSTANERVSIFTGSSDDLSHVLLQAFAPRVWPGDTTEGHAASLYEYAGTEQEQPRLVGLKDGEAELISNCGTQLGSLDNESYNAMSNDGATVFFTASACGGSLTANELFARIDNGQPGAHTVAISEPAPKDCSPCNTSSPLEAQFRGASLDGSKAFFMTEQSLLPEATGTGSNLYEYSFDGPEHGRVTLVSSGAPGGARVQGVARVSEDGSHVYFVAQGVLTNEANEFGVRAVDGADNLYMYARECTNGVTNCIGPGRRTSFIGQLAEGDFKDWAPRDERPVQATPDGRFLVFESSADLTPDQKGREEAGQVFEYDAQTARLVRVSRGEEGYGEDGNTKIYQAQIPSQEFVGRVTPTSRVQGLALSNDGSYVFFTSEDSLTPQATPGYRSVYEYHGGNVTLISGGHDLAVVERGPGVELSGTDASGRDVFFATTERLLPHDTDTQRDLYDARIGGGPAALVGGTPCTGDACQGSPSGLQPLPAPGTQLVSPEADSALSPATVSPAKQKTKPKARAKRRKHRTQHKKHRPKKSARRRG